MESKKMCREGGRALRVAQQSGCHWAVLHQRQTGKSSWFQINMEKVPQKSKYMHSPSDWREQQLKRGESYNYRWFNIHTFPQLQFLLRFLRKCLSATWISGALDCFIRTKLVSAWMIEVISYATVIFNSLFTGFFCF